jgi:hypothetical protein
MNKRILATTILLIAAVTLLAGCISSPEEKTKDDSSPPSASSAAMTAATAEGLPDGEAEVVKSLDEAGFMAAQIITAVANDTYATKVNYPPVNYIATAANITEYGNARIKVWVPGNLSAAERKVVIDNETEIIRRDFTELIAAGFDNISLQMSGTGVFGIKTSYTGSAQKAGRKFSITENTIETELDGITVTSEIDRGKLYEEIPGILDCVKKYNSWLNGTASVKAVDDLGFLQIVEGKGASLILERVNLGKERTYTDGIYQVIAAPSCRPTIVITVTGPDRISAVDKELKRILYWIKLDQYRFA